jgi:hypothetical protein
MSGKNPPSGVRYKAKVPIAIRTTSMAFVAMITARLLKRSENTPAKMETRARGSVKITKVNVVCAWDYLLDGEKGDHQFPRVVIKGSEKLSDKEAAQGMAWCGIFFHRWCGVLVRHKRGHNEN